MSSELAPGEEIAGYRIESFVARGGMAVVYRARHLRLDRSVALKVLSTELAGSDSFRQRFLRESALAASVEHPNIIPIYEAAEFGDVLLIAMRLVEGPDLRGLLERDGPAGVGLALDVGQQTANALDAAHSRGLVHRDVKPGNILLLPRRRTGSEWHVYLSDFGLTKRRDSVSDLTGAGNFIGTLDYISPEQITGGPIDGRADVYSFACVLFRTLSGVTPFERDNDAAVLYAHLGQPPPSLSSLRQDLPPAVDAVMGRALAKDPQDRYERCTEFLAAMRAALASGGAPATGGTHQLPPPPPRDEPTRPPAAAVLLRRRRPSRRATAVLAGVLAVLLIAAAAALLRGGRGGALGPAEVALPFAAEEYGAGAVSVTRSWTLSGSRGDQLRGVLRVRATRPQRMTLFETLPNSTGWSLSGARYRPAPAEQRSADRSFGYRIDAVAGWSATFTYQVEVPPGPLTLGRLQTWARQAAAAAADFRRRSRLPSPVTVTSVSLRPASLDLVASGPPHLLQLSGTDTWGRPAGVSSLAAALYSTSEPAVVLVRAGEVTPEGAGNATVTVVLGGLAAHSEVRVRPRS